MAKKDVEGWVLIPEDIVKKCSFLKKEPTSKKEGLIFFIDNHNKIGIAHIDSKTLFPGDFKFLGTCSYDKKTHMLHIPENVDIALGDGEDYYFATSITDKDYLYIYKRTSDMQRLELFMSNVLRLIKEQDK